MDPFLYQYVIGGVVFAVGLGYAWRQGYVGVRGRALVNLVILVGGFAAFAVVQGYLQYAPMSEAAAVAYAPEPGGGVDAVEAAGTGAPDWAPAERPRQLGTRLDYAIVGIYFLLILAVGTWFGRNQRSSKDFFFGGQRFSWWLIAFSLIATTVGSYSFVKYSRVAFEHGLSSSQTYLNDWLWMPLLVFGWLPILYFSRITSIPEYFERRLAVACACGRQFIF